VASTRQCSTTAGGRAVIVWVGGVLVVNILQVLTGRGHDRIAQASLLHMSDLYGRAVIDPRPPLTLLTGLADPAD
jgi:hypothetical protein